MSDHLIERGVLNYTDLVTGPDGCGTRWRPGAFDPQSGYLDCKGLVYVVLRRLGLAVPLHAGVMRSTACRGAESGELLDEFLAAQARHWQAVEKAELLGDLIVCEVDGHSHVGVLVDERGQLTLHSTPARGVHVVPLDQVVGVQRVLRFRGDES